MRVLTPTENHRLNELIGFVGMTIAILVALALISYSPHDPSFNVSADAPDLHSARNWIGPVGAYGADLLFQGFGYAVFLLPIGIFVVGSRWFRSELLESPAIKIVGYSLLVLMLPAMLTLWHIPEVRGAIPPGGLLGHLVSTGLLAAIQHGRSKPRRPGHLFRRAFSDDKIFVHRNARNAARPARQTECDRPSQRSLRRLARGTRTEAHAKAPCGDQVARPASDPVAIRG